MLHMSPAAQTRQALSLQALCATAGPAERAAPALALAMCWSAGCSAPLCCTRMVFSLALQGFVTSCIETAISVLLGVVWGRYSSTVTWGLAVEKGQSMYVLSFSLLISFFFPL